MSTLDHRTGHVLRAHDTGIGSQRWRVKSARCALEWPLAIGPALFALFTTYTSAFAGSIYICVEHTDDDRWHDEWSRGDVVVPAGAVFDWAGHIFGTIRDPKDFAHDPPGGVSKLSPAENTRRGKLIVQDQELDRKHKSGLVTIQEVKLTRKNSCAEAPAAAIRAPQWGWTVAPIFGDSTRWYQLYGVIREGKLETDFSDDSNPLDHLGASGELNAYVRGTLTEVVNLDD